MKLIKAFRYALSGFLYAVRTQWNMRFHVFSSVVVLILSFVLNISHAEWCIVLLCIGGVFSAELINTAIEVTIDIVSPEYNERAGKAKDLAAAAVLAVCIAAAIAGGIIFIPKILHLMS
jgi:diacylglycerol kinase